VIGPSLKRLSQDSDVGKALSQAYKENKRKGIKQ